MRERITNLTIVLVVAMLCIQSAVWADVIAKIYAPHACAAEGVK